MKKSFILLLILCSIFTSCNQNSKQDDTTFVSCTFDEGADQIILSNSDGTYKLSISLYGKQIEPGKYQVFGSNHEEVLEGEFLINNIIRAAKTTLFIDYSDNTIKVSGTAQLYELDGVQKSDEIIDFVYEGKLTKK